MAVRQFAVASSEELTWSIGAISGMNFGAVGMIFRRTTAGVNTETLSILTVGAGSNRASWGFSQFDQHQSEWSPTYAALASPTIGTEWWLVINRKATGSSAVQVSLFNFSTSTWTHGSTAAAANIAVASDDIVRTRSRFGPFADGRAAVSGVWKNNIPWANNAAVEAAGLEDTLQKWVDAAPTALWAFNQASVATAVDDLTGGGANQTARTGTSVVTGDDPPGFDFTLGSPPALMFLSPLRSGL